MFSPTSNEPAIGRSAAKRHSTRGMFRSWRNAIWSPGLPDGDVRTTDLERWALPTRFGREYQADLHDAPSLSLWTGLTCTEIVTDEGGDSVDHLVVKTLDGREGKVVATDYIIATGGIEATRLLLASDRHHPAGLGNAGGHLGRWYMTHVEGRFARVKFNTDKVIHEHERDNDGVYVRRRFTLSPQLQRELNMPNVAVWLVNPPISDPATRKWDSVGGIPDVDFPGRSFPARGGDS